MIDWSSLYLKYCDFDRACLPRDMARACSLSLISFPQASARYKISINDVSRHVNEIVETIPENVIDAFKHHRGATHIIQNVYICALVQENL